MTVIDSNICQIIPSNSKSWLDFFEPTSIYMWKIILVYIDSGNGEHTGQVVCGVRQNGKTIYKPIGSLYPDILQEEYSITARMKKWLSPATHFSTTA